MDIEVDQAVHAGIIACRVVVPATIKEGPQGHFNLTTRLVRKVSKDHPGFMDIFRQEDVTFGYLDLHITHRYVHHNMVTYYADPINIPSIDYLHNLASSQNWQSMTEWPVEPVLLAFEMLPAVGQAPEVK